MSDSIQAFAVGSFAPMLRSLSGLLDKAVAERRDEAALLAAQLAPDMFPLTRQVQIACDHAKSAMARLAGREPPRFDDSEQTIAELKDRIARTIAYIDSIPATEFDGAAERAISFPLRDGLSLNMSGAQLLRDWSLPHFYFHIVTAYDILRHNGIAIGKQDYLNHIGYAVRRSA